MCRSKPQGGRRCNGVTHHPAYRSASRKVHRRGGTPAEARAAGLAAVKAAVEVKGALELDSLIDQAAARAAEEHAADEALLAGVPEDLQPLARLLLGGDHEARWGFSADPIELAGPEDLDRLAAALPGIVSAPRPTREAGSIDGISIGAAVSPDPLGDDVVALLPAGDLARWRQEHRYESQRMWSAINSVRIRWASPWTDANREARRAYARGLVGWFMSLFDSLFGSPDNTSAGTQ